MTKKATEKENIINSSYAVKMELPECITDYDSFFEDLGFPKEVVRNGDVLIESRERNAFIEQRIIDKIWFQWVKLILDTGHLMMQFL